MARQAKHRRPPEPSPPQGRGSLPEPSWKMQAALAAALIAVVFLAYQPAWHGAFVWDDDLHLVNNPVLKPGGLAATWKPGSSYINYWPLTFTVYRLEYALWGLEPLGFHLVNIAIHAAAAILVWRLLVELDVPGAMAAAALFALHPVNVESVAWITQLKGLLSLLFALVAALLYLQYDRRGGGGRYAAALAAFWLSALAKGAVVTLPLVLLACAWWRRGSITRRDVLGVLPFVLIGAVMAGVEIWSQRLMQGSDVVRADSLFGRTAAAGCAVWFYLGKLLWPADLCFSYPRWQIDAASPLSYLPGLALAGLLVWAWRRRATWGRPVVMLIVCYVGLLLPVLGFVNIYFMRYSLVADHWQYAATIVPCAVAAGAVATWARRRPGRGPLALVAGLVLLAALAALTRNQSRMYRDIETLWKATLAVNPDSPLANNNLACLLYKRGQSDEAMAHYQRCLEVEPDDAEANCNFGLLLATRGRTEEAVAHFQTARKMKPGYVAACNNLAWIRATSSDPKLRDGAEAIALAQQLPRDDPQWQDTLAAAYAEAGRFPEAVRTANRARDLAVQQGEPALANAIEARARLYEAGRPFRDPPPVAPLTPPGKGST